MKYNTVDCWYEKDGVLIYQALADFPTGRVIALVNAEIPLQIDTEITENDKEGISKSLRKILVTIADKIILSEENKYE